MRGLERKGRGAAQAPRDRSVKASVQKMTRRAMRFIRLCSSSPMSGVAKNASFGEDKDGVQQVMIRHCQTHSTHRTILLALAELDHVIRITRDDGAAGTSA